MGCIPHNRYFNVLIQSNVQEKAMTKKTDALLAELRKKNIRHLVLYRFEGNRARFGKAADVAANQVNLMLTDNEEHRRNCSEDLARRIEENLNLPSGYLDKMNPEAPDGLRYIRCVELEPFNGYEPGALIDSEVIKALAVDESFLRAYSLKASSLDNLRILQTATDELSPMIREHSPVLVDLGCNAYTAPGCYWLGVMKGKKPSGLTVLRNVKHLTNGDYEVASPNGAYGSEKVSDLKGFSVRGRIVAPIRFG